MSTVVMDFADELIERCLQKAGGEPAGAAQHLVDALSRLIVVDFPEEKRAQAISFVSGHLESLCDINAIIHSAGKLPRYSIHLHNQERE